MNRRGSLLPPTKGTRGLHAPCAVVKPPHWAEDDPESARDADDADDADDSDDETQDGPTFSDLRDAEVRSRNRDLFISITVILIVFVFGAALLIECTTKFEDLSDDHADLASSIHRLYENENENKKHQEELKKAIDALAARVDSIGGRAAVRAKRAVPDAEGDPASGATTRSGDRDDRASDRSAKKAVRAIARRLDRVLRGEEARS